MAHRTTQSRQAAVAIAFLLLAGVFMTLPAQNTAPAPAPQGNRNPMAGFPDLVAGLKATPGCLGVETARTSGGKNVIFAWFENKQAVLSWYYSETHQKVMKMVAPDHQPGAPMKGVPDNVPIMAVASLTLNNKPPAEGMTLPISQISIELYTPVSGGIFVGGRFAPEGLRLPGMRDLTPK